MTALVLTALFAVGGAPAAAIPPTQDQPLPEPSVQGDWVVLAAERNGQPVKDAVHMAATIRDNTMTFAVPMNLAGGGDQNAARVLKLEFGPQGTIRVAEMSGAGIGALFTTKVKSGVYTFAGDYFSIALYGDEPAPRQSQVQDKPETCTIFLQRSDVSPIKPRQKP